MYRVPSLAAILILALVWPANGQYETSDKDTFAIRLGLMRPSAKVLRDIGSLWLGPALDWFTSYDESERPRSYASIGFFREEDDYGSLRSAPISYTWIGYSSKRERGIYFGGGPSIYLLKYEYNFPYSPKESDSAMKLGLNLVLGYRITPHYFVEYRRDWLPKWDNTNWSSSTLYFGLRTSF